MKGYFCPPESNWHRLSRWIDFPTTGEAHHTTITLITKKQTRAHTRGYLRRTAVYRPINYTQQTPRLFGMPRSISTTTNQTSCVLNTRSTAGLNTGVPPSPVHAYPPPPLCRQEGQTPRLKRQRNGAPGFHGPCPRLQGGRRRHLLLAFPRRLFPSARRRFFAGSGRSLLRLFLRRGKPDRSNTIPHDTICSTAVNKQFAVDTN